MSKILESFRSYGYLRSVCYLILGVAILFSPRSVFHSITYLIFFYLFILGLLQVIRGWRAKKYTGNVGVETTGGIIRIVLAFAVLAFSKAIVSLLPIFLGIILLIFALSRFLQNWNARKRGFATTGQLIYSALLVVAGLFLLFQPFGSLMILFQLFGFVLITMAISEAITLFQLRK